MATITHRGSLFNTTAGNHTVVATPAVGDLPVVCTEISATTSPTPTCVDNNADGLGVYTQVVTFWNAAQDRRVSIWIRNSLIGSATSTTWTQGNGGGPDVGGGLSVETVAGMSRAGSSAARQSGSAAHAAAGTPTVTLGAAMLTSNPGVGIVANQTNPAGITERGSWTERVDAGFATPTTGVEVMTIDSGETASVIAWGSTSATIGAEVVVELDASAAAAVQVPHAGAIGL